MQFILENEGAIRLSAFIGLFCLMAILETVGPRRKRSFSRQKRWFSNFAILAIGAVCARLILPCVPVSVAFYAQQNPVLFEPVLPVVVGILLLDFCIYLQHVAMHKIPVLWRLHRLHHADLDYDVTTGIRFHPIEIVLSLLFKMAIILIFAIDPLSVILFEVILNAMAMFNHANFKLPLRLDAVLRLFIVTPDFHRVHHSSIQVETNSNYGFNISLWDRLCRTYTAQPQDGHETMQIGLEYFRDPAQLRLGKMIIQPFCKKEP